MGDWGATLDPKQYVSALFSSHIKILGIQKHLCWPVGYSGMGGWGANPTMFRNRVDDKSCGFGKRVLWPRGLREFLDTEEILITSSSPESFHFLSPQLNTNDRNGSVPHRLGSTPFEVGRWRGVGVP